MSNATDRSINLRAENSVMKWAGDELLLGSEELWWSDKSGRPVTFVQALRCFTALSKDGMSSVLLCKDFLSVPEIRPYIEGIRASWVAQMVKNLPAIWETWVRSLG